MSGPGEGKIELKGAKVYIHEHGGFFVGLKKDMIKRAEELIKKK